MTISYVYELRAGPTVVATGRLSRDAALESDDPVVINGLVVVVRDVVTTLDPHEQRLILERA